MSIFSEIFGKKNHNTNDPILVDMHSHLIPGIDDGSKSLEESIEMIRAFIELGYKKLITTPHIMGDFYKNTPQIIYGKLKELNNEVAAQGLDIQIEAAAEYYLDESFIQKLADQEELMTFGENYLLFETSYLNEPSFLSETIFQIKANGYWPVLAHPERYQYFYSDFGKIERIFDLGVSFQLNINSISGYYSKAAENLAVRLIKHNMVNFVGSDCHSMKHLEALKKSRANKEYQNLSGLSLLNNSLLG